MAIFLFVELLYKILQLYRVLGEFLYNAADGFVVAPLAQADGEFSSRSRLVFSGYGGWLGTGFLTGLAGYFRLHISFFQNAANRVFVQG